MEWDKRKHADTLRKAGFKVEEIQLPRNTALRCTRGGVEVSLQNAVFHVHSGKVQLSNIDYNWIKSLEVKGESLELSFKSGVIAVFGIDE